MMEMFVYIIKIWKNDLAGNMTIEVFWRSDYEFGKQLKYIWFLIIFQLSLSGNEP